MARTSIPYVKTLFETGDRPTQEDYVDLIDTLSSQATDLGTSGNNNENVISEIENPTVIDSFSATEWRLIKYIISISKTTNGDNKFYATELSILVDGTDVNVSEYGTIDTDGNMGTISVSKTGSTVAITLTPDSVVKPVTLRYARIGLKA
jgi:hypothetical protein